MWKNEQLNYLSRGITDSEHLFERAEERRDATRGSSESARRARWLLSNHRAKTRTLLFLYIYMKCRFKTLSLCRCSGHNKLLINPQWGLIEGLGQLLFCECASECFSYARSLLYGDAREHRAHKISFGALRRRNDAAGAATIIICAAQEKEPQNAEWLLI